MTGHWSLGVLVGLPIAGLLALVCIGLAVLLFLLWRREPKGPDRYGSDRALFRGGFAAAVCGLLATIGTTAWVMFPWSSEYHRWQPVSGVVLDTSSRLLASDTKGGGTTQRFVVQLAGVGERSCDDTRCALVKVGDTLSLECKRAWQFAGTDGWDCNFVASQSGKR